VILGADDSLGELAEYFRTYADQYFGSFEPHYQRICHAVAERPDVLGLIAEQPADAHQPNVILAAARFVLFSNPEHPLAQVYAGHSDADPGPLFCDLIVEHRAEIADLMATRRTQTNEVGRAAPLALGLTEIHRRTSQPLAWIDLGCSAGLNLQLDRFAIDYRFADRTDHTGPPSAPVSIECQMLSDRPKVEAALPAIAWRLGIDRSPIDPTDEHDARWLRSCLFPSRAERAARLDTALSIARSNPVEVRRADAAAGLVQAIADAPGDTAVAITTTWVWYYLPAETRRSTFDAMRNASRPVYWFSLEAAGVVEGSSQDEPPKVDPPSESSALALHSFRGDGTFEVEPLGWSHPHGAWIDWRSSYRY